MKLWPGGTYRGIGSPPSPRSPRPTSRDRRVGRRCGVVWVNEDITEQKYSDIRRRAEHWPAPWDQIVRHSVDQRRIIATPITEYVPHRVARGRMAIIGDAAHVPSLMTGAGFDTGLVDAEALGELTADGVAGDRGSEVLKSYEKQRLRIGQRMVRSGQGFGRDIIDGAV